MTTAESSDDGREARTAGERSEADGGGGLSRRDALRRFGIAAGVAWTAPVVMSLYSPAGAQTVGSLGPNTTTTTPELDCIGAQCPDNRRCSSVNPLEDCICVSTADGLGLCIPGVSACVDFVECGPENKCPTGSICALDTCCGVPVCIPLDLAERCPPDPTDDQPGPEGARKQQQRLTGTRPGTVGG